MPGRFFCLASLYLFLLENAYGGGTPGHDEGQGAQDRENAFYVYIPPFFVLSLDGAIIWKCFGTDPLPLGRHPGGHIVALLPILRPELLRDLLAQPVRIQVQNDLLDEQDI